MSTECIITFVDNEQGVFHPGQLLRYNVLLITKKIKNRVKDVSITVHGAANTSWDEKRSEKNSDGSTSETSTTYTGEEVYFSSKNIVQKDHRTSTFHLMPGTYAYNFEIQLPPVLPTSHLGFYGRINYEVKCTISRSWKFDNVFVKPFTIISPLDLNHIPILKEPVDICDEKSTVCCCIKMSPLKLRAKIPTSGYVSGQSIICNVEASNESMLSCSGITIALYRRVVYTATSPNKETQMKMDKISNVSLPKVPKFAKKLFMAVIMVPSTPPSTLDTCKIVNTKYMIIVEAKVGSCHRNLKLSLPITIGTTPLIENVDGLNSMDKTNPISELSIEPPTYEEALGMTEKGKTGRDKNNEYEKYSPKYPVYKNMAKPQQEYEKHYGAKLFYSTFL